MVTDSSGESIRYRSHAELAAALASIDSEIQRAGGNRPPSSIIFNTSKGI